MLFLTLPLALVLIALLGVTVIVWRKMVFLRKLTPEAHEMGDTWLHDMAPEVVDWFRSVAWKQYMHNLLVEFEKLLRQVRSLFSAIDRTSERLVHKVRRVHQETAKQVEAQQKQEQEAKEEDERDAEAIDMDDLEQLKLEEQRLIVAIAQDPKDAVLYSDLARVYTRVRNYGDAVEALSAAVKLEPTNESYAKRLEGAKRRLATSMPTV